MSKDGGEVRVAGVVSVSGLCPLHLQWVQWLRDFYGGCHHKLILPHVVGQRDSGHSLLRLTRPGLATVQKSFHQAR